MDQNNQHSGNILNGEQTTTIDIATREISPEDLSKTNYCKKNDYVILLGTAYTLPNTPWGLKDHDYWACAPVIAYKAAENKKIDLLFELHPSEYWMTITDRLNRYDAPVFMQERYKEIPRSIKYPLDKVQEMLGHIKLKRYFTSTISYMIALAIYMGYKSIELYGIHMASTEEEYSMQRSCCEMLLAYGWGKGINFWLPDESDLFKNSAMYGYEQQNHLLLKMINVKDGYQRGANDLEAKLREAEKRYYMQQGAVRFAEDFIKSNR